MKKREVKVMGMERKPRQSYECTVPVVSTQSHNPAYTTHKTNNTRRYDMK